MACCGNCAKGMPCTKTCSGCASSPNPAGLGMGESRKGPSEWGGVMRVANEPCMIYCDYDPFRFAVVGAAAAGIAHWRKATTPFVVGAGVVAALAATVILPVARIVFYLAKAAKGVRSDAPPIRISKFGTRVVDRR